MTHIANGVIAPILTPFNDDQSIADDLYVAHAHRLFADGCVALAPFGTTGEALSVGIDERISAIDGLIDGGIDPARLIPGTGLTSLADTARLSAACLERGCAAVMTLPPFYFKQVSDDGLIDYFGQLVGALGADAAKIYLYHIPQVAGVGIPPAVARALHQRFPEQIIGIKDSSGDWDNTAKLLDIDGLIVYPGSELPLIEAMERDAPGCISATANINAAAIADVIARIEKGDVDGARQAHEAVKAFRVMVQNSAPIPAQKHLLAEATGDARWGNLRAPLTGISEADGKALTEALKKDFDFSLAAA